MKKRISFLILAAMLLCASTAYAFNDQYYGEWLFYGSIFLDGEGNQMPSLTRAEAYASDGILDDGFILYEDGTVDIRTGGAIVDTGVWAYDEAGSNPEESIECIQMADSSGAVMGCAFYNSFMICGGNRGELQIRDIYYKPDLYALTASELANRAWKLTYYYIEDYYDSTLGGKYDLVSPDELQRDYRFTLHDDGTASILNDCIPMTGIWYTEGLNIRLNASNGTEFTLELQYDDSLFGTYTSASEEVEAPHVSFQSIEPFSFSETPASLDSLTGSWHMIGLRDKLLFYYPLEDLTFTQDLEIGSDFVTLYQEGKNGTRLWEFTPTVVGGPVLDEDDTGTVLLCESESGGVMPFWLLSNGMLYRKQPGSISIYYERD